MKKLLLVLTAVLAISALNAQPSKNLEKAIADSQNPKKSEKPATWVKLANAYIDEFDAPTKGIWTGASRMEVKMILKDNQILQTTQEEIDKVPYNVDVYEDKKLYYNDKDILQTWVITKPTVDGNLLLKSLEAFNTAVEKDTKNASRKNIVDGMTLLKDKFVNEGMNYYTLNNSKLAAESFENSVKTSSNPVLGLVDTAIIYYTAVAFSMSKDYDKSTEYFNKCLEVGYDAKGDLYATLAENYISAKDTVKAKEILSTGFTKYPTNQTILVTLINLYQDTNEDPAKILVVIKNAQAIEPNNATLFYAEGNVYKKMNKNEEAIAAFTKSFEINSSYYYAPYAIGDCYYSMAIDYQAKADAEMDDNIYAEYIKKLEESLKNAIEPFETAFRMSNGDLEFRNVCAEYLKNIYYRFSGKDPKYAEAYEKYKAYLAGQTE